MNKKHEVKKSSPDRRLLYQMSGLQVKQQVIIAPQSSANKNIARTKTQVKSEIVQKPMLLGEVRRGPEQDISGPSREYKLNRNNSPSGTTVKFSSSTSQK